jgi:hypothetical protein
MELAMICLAVWVPCGVGAAMIANSKGYSGCEWFAVGMLFGPLVLLVVGFMAPARTTPESAVPAPAAGAHTVLSSDTAVRVVNDRLLVGDRSFHISELQPVEVLHPIDDWWRIYLKDLSGIPLHSLPKQRRTNPVPRVQRSVQSDRYGFTCFSHLRE